MNKFISFPNKIRRKLLIYTGPLKKVFYENNQFFNNNIGLEIGGPSVFFSNNGFFPVYKKAKRIDGVNFSQQTVWEGTVQEGFNFSFNKNKNCGYQYIMDGVELNKIGYSRYDFLLSCHSLEHIANPLRALVEWKRVLKSEAIMVVIVPDRKYTFDHLRDITSFEHILWDYKNNTNEDDLSHLEEILSVHDITLDKAVSNYEKFRERSFKNYSNRCLHHHVFNENIMYNILTYLNFEIIYLKTLSSFHIVSISKKIR